MRTFAILLTATLFGCSASPTAGGGVADPRAAAWDRATPEQREWALRHPEAAGLSEEESAWVRKHPDAARSLGNLDAGEREEMQRRYDSLPPELQQRVRENPEAFLD